MKKIIKIVAVFFLSFTLFYACDGETDPTYETRLDEYAAPIIVFAEDVPDEIPIKIEDAYSFKFHLEGEAGLVEVQLNGEKIHTSPYGQLIEDVSYTFVMPDEEYVDLVFSVIDEDGKMASTKTVKAIGAGRMAPEFLVTDFSGSLIEFVDEPIPNQGGGNYAAKVASTSDYAADNFTIRSLWANASNFTNFININADAPEGGKAIRFTKTGVAINVIANLGVPIPENYISDIVDGKRVYQFDIYYDNSANPDSAADLSKALIFDVYMSNFSKYKNDKAGIFETYSATIPSANEWHTVQCAIKTGGGYHTGDVAVNEIDAFSLKLSSGYDTRNPYYIKNIKIVKVN